MKKEYLILIALILILGAYLVFHKENRDNYVLPEIAKIDTGKITGINIGKKQESIKFIKKDDKWVVTDKAYPADLSYVNNMLDTFKELKLSALVSRTGDLKRYELDDENKIQVQVLEGGKIIFEFTMGKTAPSFNHTFVMLAGSQNVYHANGSFRSYFDKNLNEFRDKKVLEFKEESIKKLSIEKQGLSKTLNKTKTDKANDKTRITWKFEDKKTADKEMVQDLLSSVSFMQCEKFLESISKEELAKEKPYCKISLENGGTMELILFQTDKEDIFKGISSMNDYVFELSRHNGKDIIKNIDKLLGIFKEEEN